MPIKLDAEKAGKEIAKKYKVEGFPTILFVDAGGEVYHRIGGYMTAKPFTAEMQKAAKSFAELPKLQARLKEAPDDGEANARIAIIYAAREKTAEAAAALAKAEKAGFKGPELARAYSALGDFHQGAGEFAKAIPLFAKADAAATTVDDRAYAKVSMMVCHANKPDMPAAKKVAKELLALKDCPQEYADMAKQVLASDD